MNCPIPIPSPNPHPWPVTWFETSRAAPRSTVAAAHNPRARHRHRSPKSPGRVRHRHRWKWWENDGKMEAFLPYLHWSDVYDIALSTRWALRKLRRPCWTWGTMQDICMCWDILVWHFQFCHFAHCHCSCESWQLWQLSRCHQVVKTLHQTVQLPWDFLKKELCTGESPLWVGKSLQWKQHTTCPIPTLGFQNHGDYTWVLPQYSVQIGTKLPMLLYTGVSVEPSPTNDLA